MQLPKTAFRFILHFVLKQKFAFFILVLMSVLWAFNEVIFPYFLKQIINILQTDQARQGSIFTAVKNPFMLLIISWTVMEVTQRAQGILQILTFPKFRANIRFSVFDYVKAHSQEYFSSHFAGYIAKKMSDLPTSCHTILEIICFQFAAALTGGFIILWMMYVTNPLFALILFSWLCIHMLIISLFLRYGNVLWETHSDAVSTLSGKIIDAFSNILNVRLFARGSYEADYLGSYQNDEIIKSKKAMWAMELTRMGLSLNGLCLIFGMIASLLYAFSKHTITIGDFTQISMQTFWMLGWIWFISFQMTLFAKELGTIKNSLGLIIKPHDIVDASNASALKVTQGEICLSHVSFAYNNSVKVFEDLTVTIPGGKKIGLVGFSGSGKSTFVNLILRFYDIQSGQILIDGQDISKVTQESLRSHISMIPQDPALFHRTLMENIRYGRLNASDQEVIEAAQAAHCHEFIQKLDKGYDALVGERGVKLSGGQRQRIAIARAILKNAPILILDEATSSLDSVTEKLIQESLTRLMKNRTTLVIAHRLSTLNNMDKILVFHQNTIIEAGTQKELLQRQGHFTKLWTMQTGGFLPEKE